MQRILQKMIILILISDYRKGYELPLIRKSLIELSHFYTFTPLDGFLLRNSMKDLQIRDL